MRYSIEPRERRLRQNHIIKMKLLMEYQKKGIFLLKKDKKLLMN